MRRLIESTNFPLRVLSELSAAEKMRREGHIQTFHIWWARRPLASTRATLLACILPDPLAQELSENNLELIGTTILDHYRSLKSEKGDELNRKLVHQHLLRFIEEFSVYENSVDPRFLAVARKLVQQSKEIVHGDESNWRVMDSFVGGGSLQVESNRLGCETFVGDLNPVPVLINTILAIHDPESLTNINTELLRLISSTEDQLKEQCGDLFLRDGEGHRPLAWFHSMLASCPSCEEEVPLLKSMWFFKKANKRLHARLTGTPESYWLEFETDFNDEDVPQGVVVDGVMTCPWCQSEHRVSELADDISARKNSEKESRLMAVMYEDAFENRSVRSPVEHDHTLLNLAQQRAMVLESESIGQFSLIPDEPLPVPNEGKTTTLGMGVMAYGITNWGSFFTPRQKVVHGTLVKILRTQMESISDSLSDKENEAVRILLAFCMSRFVDKNANVCLWNSQAINIEHVMSQNHLNPVWSYVEGNPIGGWTADWRTVSKYIPAVIERRIAASSPAPVHVHHWSAFDVPLDEDSIDIGHIDPPYYDSVPYADLSDFFIVWLKRLLHSSFPTLLSSLSPKEDECIKNEDRGKSDEDYEAMMARALAEINRVLRSDGVLCLVFASKSWAAWETLVSSLIRSNFVIETMWPIQTEKRGRLRSYNSAALNASQHLICRPRRAGETREQKDFSEHQATLMSTLDRRILACIEQNIHGIDAVASCMGAAFHLATKYELLKENGGIYSLEEYFSHTLGMIAQRTVANLLPLEVMNQLDNVSRFMIEVLMTMSSGEGSLTVEAYQTLLNDHDIEDELIAQYIDRTDEEVRLNHGMIADPMYAHGPLPIQDEQLSFRTETQATLFGDWSKAPEQRTWQQQATQDEHDERTPSIRSVFETMLSAAWTYSHAGTTQLKRFIQTLDRPKLIRAYVQAAFLLVEEETPLHKALEGVLQTF